MENIAFNPQDYQDHCPMPIDGSFWVELDGNEDVPTTTTRRFYHPSSKAKHGWAEKLEVYGVQPFFVLNPEVCALPLTLSPDVIEQTRLGMNKYVVRSLKDRTPVPPPEKLEAEACLETLKMRAICEMSFSGKKYEDLTSFEQNVLEWHSGYGFLWDHRQNEGVLFPRPGEKTRLKHEIDREYLFQMPGFHHVVISLARTPNFEKAVWGLRRTADTDWPFDKMYGRPWCNTDKVVDGVNEILSGLESFISS